jgi:hypothetical protein
MALNETYLTRGGIDTSAAGLTYACTAGSSQVLTKFWNCGWVMGDLGFPPFTAFVADLNSLDCVRETSIGCACATLMNFVRATPMSLGFIEITSVGLLGDVGYMTARRFKEEGAVIFGSGNGTSRKQ